MDGRIELDRRSYLGLGKSRFTVQGSEPRRAFKRLGTVSRDLREMLRSTPEGKEGVRRFHRLLFLGYACSMLAGLLLGVAAGSLLVVEVLAVMDPKQMTSFLSFLHRYLQALPEGLLALASLPLFILAFVLDHQAYRSILTTIDSVAVPGTGMIKREVEHE